MISDTADDETEQEMEQDEENDGKEFDSDKTIVKKPDGDVVS